MGANATIISLACQIAKLKRWGKAWQHTANAKQAEIDELRTEHARQLAGLRESFRAQTEASQTPKRQHPAKVGEWVRRTKRALPNAQIGDVVQVVAHHDDVTYRHKGGFWEHTNCEPCDPPEATHDTPAGKAAAESAAPHLKPIAIKGLIFDGKQMTVQRKQMGEEVAIVIHDSDTSGESFTWESFMYLTQDGAREMAAALTKLAGGAA